MVTRRDMISMALASTAWPALRADAAQSWPASPADGGPGDEPFWARSAEAGIPVNVHVGLSGSPSGTPALGHSFNNAFTGAFRFYDSPVRLAVVSWALGLVTGLPEKNDIAAMKREMEALNAAQHKAAEAMYRAASASGAAGGGAGDAGQGAAGGQNRPSGDVIDAEVVEEEKK